VEYVIETYIPHARVVVAAPELRGAYEKLREAACATVTWRSGEETAVLVAVGEDYSYINLQHNGDFHTLTVPASHDGEDAEIALIGGVDTMVPARHLAARELGLDVLQKAPDIPRILTEHAWEEQ